MASLALNARYALRAMTGVERTVVETMGAWEGPLPEVFMPSAPSVPVPGFGHIWEQSVLPFRARGRTLWSPCNFGPVLQKNHLVTIHDMALFEHPEWYSFGYARVGALIQTALIAKATIAVPSQFTADRLLSIKPGVRGRLEVIPWANVGPTVSLTQASPQLPELDYLLTVGSLQPRKNYGRLLAAWQSIVDRHPGVSLLVVGATNAVFNRLGFGADQGVKYLGYVGEEQLRELYGGCRAYVSVSLYEGFGLTPLEAAAHGASVIASDIPAHREVLEGSNARLVDPLSVDAIAAALDDAAGGQLSPTRLRTKRTWAAVAADYADLLVRLA